MHKILDLKRVFSTFQETVWSLLKYWEWYSAWDVLI